MCRSDGAIYAHPRPKELRARVLAIARILGSVVEQTGLVGRWPVWQGCVSSPTPSYTRRPPLPPPATHLFPPSPAATTMLPATSLFVHSAVTFGCVSVIAEISRYAMSYSSSCFPSPRSAPLLRHSIKMRRAGENIIGSSWEPPWTLPPRFGF